MSEAELHPSIDRRAEIKTGDIVYFEGTPYGNQNGVYSGIYKLGEWDDYYGFRLYKAGGVGVAWCDSTRANTFKIKY